MLKIPYQNINKDSKQIVLQEFVQRSSTSNKLDIQHHVHVQ